MQSSTTTELNLADYFRANNMKYQEMKFAKMDDVFKAYDSGQCDVLTADVSRLYALRLKLSKPNDHVILPDVISKEPLAPVVRQKDDDWLLDREMDVLRDGQRRRAWDHLPEYR